jgi:ferritin-like metal-binding protein YciE
MKPRTASKTAPRKKSATVKSNRKDTTFGFRELFIAELKEIYWAEKAIAKSFPKIIKNASDKELKDALHDHLSETTEHVSRVEDLFGKIELTPRSKKCEAMVGLIKEAEEIMKETPSGIIRDAGIIAAVQKIEHYEIASYGTLCAFARTLGYEDVVSILQETLTEEKALDSKFTVIAASSINIKAVRAEVEGFEEEYEEEGMRDKAPTRSNTPKKPFSL